MPKTKTFAQKQIKKKDDKVLSGDFETPSKTLAPPPLALGGSGGSAGGSGGGAAGGGGSTANKPVSVPIPMPQEQMDPDFFTQGPPEGEQLPPELQEAKAAYDAHLESGEDASSFTGFKDAAQKMNTEDGEQKEKDEGELTPDVPANEIEKAGEGGGDEGGGEGEGGEGAATGGEGAAGAEGGGEGGAPNMGGSEGGEGGEGAGSGGESSGAMGSGGGAASPPQAQSVQGGFGAGTEPTFSVINDAAKEGMGSVEILQSVGNGKYLILGGGGAGGGGGAPIQKQDDPDQEEPQHMQVPQDITTQSLEEDRAKCQALVTSFQTNATSELGQLTTFKGQIAGEMQQWAEKGKAKVTENLQAEKSKVRAAYGDAKMKVLGESVKALGEARRIRKEAEKKIKTEAKNQRKAIQEAATQNLAALSGAAPTLIASLNTAIAAGKKGIADAAKTKGEAAKAAAETAAQGYLSESPPSMSWGEKLRYGPGYEKRKLKAKAEAARSVGDGFAKSFQQTAQEQAQGLEAGKGELSDHIRKSIQEGKKAIKDGQKQALKSIVEAEKSGIKSVKATYDQKVEAAKAKLSETKGQLDTKKAGDLAQLDSTAQQKKAAIDSQASSMTSQMEGSAQTSIDSLSQQINTVAQQAGQYPVPDPDSLSTNLDAALGKVRASIGAAEQQLTEGISAAGSSLEQMGASSSEALGAITTSAETSAQGLVDGATAAFDALLSELETSANETADQIATGLGEMTTQITTFMGDLGEQTVTGLESMVTNTEAKMTENTEGMGLDFQNGIDTQLQSKITEEAEKAAKNVPSMWAVAFSWAVKILVAIAITAVCCALIASGVGLLAVVLVGAAMGAVGGALTYGTDCALGMQEFSWGGLGMSMATGAISGAVTALGAGAGAAFTSKVFGEAAKMTVGQQVASYAAETVIGFGIDSMGSGITNMINEGSFSPGAFWRGVQKDAVQNFAGNAIGGLIGMKLSKSPKFNSFMDSMQNTRFVQGVKDIDARVFGTGGGAPKVDLPSGSGPEVSTTSAPETSAPTSNSGPEVAAPEVKAPEVAAPEAKAPEVAAPEAKAPETKAPETSAPEAKGPETTAPETSAPEAKGPETTAPETSAPEVKAPEVPTNNAPETKAPEVPTNNAPETKAPEVPTNNAPETKGPEVQGNDGPEVKGPEAEGGNVTNAQGPTKGADLAEEMGYPKAPEGYHWANKDGVPIIRRNPGNAASGEYPQLRYDAEAGTLRNVETGQPVTNVEGGGGMLGDVYAKGSGKNRVAKMDRGDVTQSLVDGAGGLPHGATLSRPDGTSSTIEMKMQANGAEVTVEVNVRTHASDAKFDSATSGSVHGAADQGVAMSSVRYDAGPPAKYVATLDVHGHIDPANLNKVSAHELNEIAEVVNLQQTGIDKGTFGDGAGGVDATKVNQAGLESQQASVFAKGTPEADIKPENISAHDKGAAQELQTVMNEVEVELAKPGADMNGSAQDTMQRLLDSMGIKDMGDPRVEILTNDLGVTIPPKVREYLDLNMTGLPRMTPANAMEGNILGIMGHVKGFDGVSGGVVKGCHSEANFLALDGKIVDGKTITIIKPGTPGPNGSVSYNYEIDGVAVSQAKTTYNSTWSDGDLARSGSQAAQDALSATPSAGAGFFPGRIWKGTDANGVKIAGHYDGTPPNVTITTFWLGW